MTYLDWIIHPLRGYCVATGWRSGVLTLDFEQTIDYGCYRECNWVVLQGVLWAFRAYMSCLLVPDNMFLNLSSRR